MNTTIVSAFIENTNERKSEFYLERGKKLLELPYKKIIFIEKNNIDYFKDYKNDNTLFVEYSKDDLTSIYDIPKDIILPKNRNKEKDTLMYLLVMNNKSEWIRKAIELKFYNTPNYIWIDFGITHVLKNYIDKFEQVVGTCITKKYDKIRIGAINNLNLKSPYGLNLESDDKYNYPLWFFAGGVVGGHKDHLLLFADLCKNKLKQLINSNRITWEVNVWYFVYLENKELFDPYYCEHDIRLLNNY